MLLATWNVNSIKARLENVLSWLKEAGPDVVLLQELKCVDEAFPREPIEDLGYNIAVHGQKTYNGVAILSKFPLEDVATGLPGAERQPEDDHARYIEAVTGGVRVASIYLPNGNPVPGPKFDYKLGWMDRLVAHAGDLLALEERTVLAGDYNVCPTDADVFDPARFAGDALCQPESRARFRQILNMGYTEAWRAFHPDGPQEYSYWDYQGGAWDQNNGLRIDHLLLSPQAADCLSRCGIDRGPRAAPKASDHTPVWCELAV